MRSNFFACFSVTCCAKREEESISQIESINVNKQDDLLVQQDYKAALKSKKEKSKQNSSKFLEKSCAEYKMAKENNKPNSKLTS